MTKLLRSTGRLWLLFAAFLLAQSARAQLLTDDFPNAGILTSNGWTQTGSTTTNAINTNLQNLTYPGLTTSGNSASLTTTGQDVSRGFTAITAGSAYGSCLINVSSAQAGGDYFIHFANSTAGTGFTSRVFVKSVTGGFQLGISKVSTTVVYAPTTYSFNTTYFIVFKYTLNAGTSTDDVASLFIAPLVGGTEPPPTVTEGSGNDGAIAAVNLRQGAIGTASNLLVDYIRIGTTWADVTSGSAPVTPVASLSVNPATLTGFAATQGTASTVQTYTLTGSNLGSTPVSVSATANIELSTTATGTFTPTLSVPPAAGTVSQSIYVRLTSAAPTGAFSGTITNTANSTLAAAVTVSGQVNPPAPTPTVTLSASGTSITESPAQSVTITATASATAATDQTVGLTTGGSAANGADYALSGPTITILSGQLSGSITLTSLDDLISEGTETAILTISSTSAGLTIGSPSSQTISITDNDVASLVIVESNGSTTVTEGGATDTYTIALNGQPTADVTVTLTPDAQVSVSPALLTFTAANYTSPQTVTVTAVDDAVVEGLHSGIIQQTVTGGGTYNGIAVASVTAVITDNDVAATPVLAVNPTTLTAFTATTGTASASQTYTLTGSNLSSSVSVSAPAGFQISADGSSFQDQLTLPLASSAVSATIAVRLTAVATGSFSGSITNVSSGLTATVAVTGQVSATVPAPSNALYYPLATAPFTQNWTNTGLITTNDSWTNVQSIIGYRGDDLTTATGTDPQTILSGAVTPINVIANQTNPNTLGTGGVAEFEITNPTVALNGSGTADAPNIVIYLNTTGVANVNVAYNVRDLDGSVDNATQQVALQYRIGDSGNFINVPGAFVTDATAGPSSATQVTPVSIVLPTEVENQSQVQLRIITANAVGNDEWVGIDDIVVSGVTGGVVTPTVTVQATDASASEAANDPAVFTITRTGSTTAALAVNYVVGTGAGQATNGTDYTPMLTGTATIGVGQTTASITITPVDDALVEGNETVVLSLTTGTGYTVNSPRSATVTIADNDVLAGAVRIHDIQGNGHISTLDGNTITNIPGIVTVLRTNGFWMQDPMPDADDNTSEGIFVFTNTAPGRTVGDAVLVSGTVQEFRANLQNLSTTQITSPTVSPVSSGNALPDPIVISSQVAAGVRRIPTNTISNDFPASGDVELSVFDPAEDGLDFFETLEGMRVQINNPVTTSFRNANGQVFVIADKGAGATGLNARGTLTISGANTTDINSAITNSDFNPERIQIDDVLYGTGNTPNQNVGTLLNTIIGVVNYDFQNVTVLPSVAPTVSTLNVPLTKESTTLLPTASQLTIASFNVENLAGNEPQAKYDGLALGIKNSLGSPDILALEEIQDNNGATDNGVVDATTTLDRLTTAISAAGGPSYQYRQINPVNDQDGGEPGGNIRVGILFNPARVQFVDRAGGGPTVNTTVTNVGGQPQLSASPGRILDTNPGESDSYAGDDFTATRKPLVGELVFNGQPVYMIVNHFSSRGGSGQLAQRFQPPTQEAQGRREEQGKLVNAFVDQLLAVNPNANVVVLGDFNEFQFLPELQYLKGNLPGETPVLTNLIESLPVQERYTYSFDGNAQALDYILASNALAGKLDAYDAVHLNSEFLDQLSDHDPSVARFNFGVVVAPSALTLVASANPTTLLTTGTTTLSATVSGGTSPYSYSFTGPGTIQASGNTATVSTLPAGVQTFTVVARDATSPTSQTIAATVSVTVSAPAPVNTAPVATANANQTATVGTLFTYTVNAFADAQTPNGLTYSASFNPANGLTFNPATRVIQGTPVNTGVTSVTITATDPGSLSASTSFTITVIPAPVATNLVVLQRDPDNGQLNTNTLKPYLQLQNQGTTPLPYTELTVRYYLTVENPAPIVAQINYAQLGTDKVHVRYVALTTPVQGATGYLEYSFDASAGSLGAMSNSGDIQNSVRKADYSGFFQGDDYSYVLNRDFMVNSRITAYRNGQLVFGTEPGSLPGGNTPLTLTASANPTTLLTTGTTTLSATVSGGTSPYSYSFTGPGTISTSGNTATVSTLPAGVQTFTVVARDATSPTSQTIAATVSVTVSAPAPVNTAPVATANANQTATVGTLFTYTVNAFADAQTPNGLTYSASFNPANGLTFNPATRVIQGTPVNTGVTSVTITATDPGSLSASTSFTITVIPAPVATNLVVLQRDPDNGQLNTNTLKPYLQLQNQGTTPLPYTELTVRYYLTVENPAPIVAQINYAQLGTDKVHVRYVALTTPVQGATGYLEYSFDASAGSLGAMSNSGDIQNSVRKADYSGFFQGDDYSYVLNRDFMVNSRITAYRNGQLVFGTEPGSLPGGNTPLTLTASANPTTLLTTGTTTLSATVSGGTSPYSYSFTGPGTISTSGNTATVSTLPAGVQTFTVVAQDATAPTSQTISATVSVTVTPAPVATTNLVVLQRDPDNGQLNTNTLKPYLQLQNQGTTPLPYTELTVRYYLTVENPAPIVAQINYAQLGTDKVHVRYVALTTPVQGATGYLEYSFDASAGSLGAMSSSGDIQNSVRKADYSGFFQGDDYSYVLNRDFAINPRITAYRNGQLVFGTEPGSGVRLAAKEADAPLQVRVLGNPVRGAEILVEVQGAAGQPVQLRVTDLKGHLVSELAVEQAGVVEQQRLMVSQQLGGLLFLQVSTPTQTRTIKVLKVD